MEPCDKGINAMIPGSNVRVQLFCKFAKGHTGLHTAKATMNGIEFEVDYGPNEVN